MIEWKCVQCDESMVSISNGVTWCPNCGKISSSFSPVMIPKISQIIFDAKTSVEKKTTKKFEVRS